MFTHLVARENPSLSPYKINHMIKVYFESGRHAECVATFISEEVYIAALPSLEALAESQGMSVTESIEED